MTNFANSQVRRFLGNIGIPFINKMTTTSCYGFGVRPRCCLDTSSVFDREFTEYLRGIADDLPYIRENMPKVLDAGQYVDPWDRPFLVLPPCGEEMRVGLQVLKDMNHEFAEEMESTLNVLNQLVEASFVTGDTKDSFEHLEPTRSERKLLWKRKLKLVKERLDLQKKRMAFLTENPVLLVRTSMAGIMSGSA